MALLVTLLAEEGLDSAPAVWMAGLVKAAQPYCTTAHLNSPFSMQLNKKLYKSQCKRPETAQSPSAIQRIKSVHVVLEGESQITWDRDGPVVTLSLRAMIISSEVTGKCFSFPFPLKLGRSQSSLRHVTALSYSLWQVAFRDFVIHCCLHSS